MATYILPFPNGSWGRTDQGVDFPGAGNIKAVGAGKILYVGTGAGNTGWPGLGTYILEELTHPYQGHKYVYYAEDINPSVKKGQMISAGSVIGRATGGATGIEVGWGSATPNLTLARSTTGYVEGQQTAAGTAFRNFLQSLASGKNVSPTPAKAKTTAKVNTVASTPTENTSPASGGTANTTTTASPDLAAQLTAATAPAAQPAASGSAAGHNIWNDLVFAFVGTAALAVVAHINDRVGKVLLAIMVGFLFMWFMMHSQTISGWINTLVPQTAPTG